MLQCLLTAFPAKNKLQWGFTIIKCLLIGPVGSLFNILKMWVLFTKSSVEYSHLYSRPYKEAR